MVDAGSISVRIWAISVYSSLTSAQFRPNLGRTRPSSANTSIGFGVFRVGIGPHWAGLGPNLADFGHFLAQTIIGILWRANSCPGHPGNSGCRCSESAQFGWASAHICLTSVQFWPRPQSAFLGWLPHARATWATRDCRGNARHAKVQRPTLAFRRSPALRRSPRAPPTSSAPDPAAAGGRALCGPHLPPPPRRAAPARPILRRRLGRRRTRLARRAGRAPQARGGSVRVTWSALVGLIGAIHVHGRADLSEAWGLT